VAALVERWARKRRWIWTEWLSATLGLILGSIFLGFLYWPFPNPDEDQIVLRIVMPFWILTVAAVSWLIVWAWSRLSKLVRMGQA
jgi:hypothetical protein